MPSQSGPVLNLIKLSLTLCGCAVALSAQNPKPVDFQRQVRPILSHHCFQCHGPDSGTRMAGLRLDQKETAFEVRKRGAPIVPGDPESSLLYKRISDPNPARRMPPESAHKELNADQIELLKRWIQEGAPWREHWAFKAPVKPSAPPVSNPEWVRNPIDSFVLARLDAQALTPAPEADRRTLIRRAALDLTGLPPKPADIEQFLADSSPQAYEHMVDRYLASPHYGEHRGRYWLDAARYGDTHGIHFDNYRQIWPYRDWVIQAFNRNLPFNEFTIEQLAGDLLPEATVDQRVATGFHRCNVTTNEAGIIDDEYREIYAKDRADTTAAVWLGMTVGCATCHDHKFDPISQKDFYSLGAFFRNTPQKVMDDNLSDPGPVEVVPRPEDRAKWEATSARLAAIPAEMKAARESAREQFAQWLSRRTPVTPISPLDDRHQIYAADLVRLANAAPGLELGASPVPGRPALHFLHKEGVRTSDAPRLSAEKPFSVSVTFFLPEGDKEETHAIVSHHNPKGKDRGWVVEAGSRVALRLTGDDGKSIEVRARHPEDATRGAWNHIVTSYDGSRQQTGLTLYLNGRAVPIQGGSNNVELRGDIATDAPLVLGRSLAGGAIADFRMFDRVVSESEAALLNQWPAIDAALSKPANLLTDSDRDALLTWYLQKYDEPFQALAAEQTKLNMTAAAIARNGALTLVMAEKAETTPFAHVLYRGAYDQRRDRVEANTPAILPPMPASLPRNRLGFAKWLFLDDHPLTARVTVNRMWQEIFGTGLVKTPDDFGSQGEPPSHPELLDWLAVDLRESGWDVKRFYKQVLMSSTYRQSAQTTPEKIAKDPDNRLLSRGPRFRMDGEMVRDYALAASGLLSPKVGGPSVKPYQPPGIWEAVAMEDSNTRYYKQDNGNALYRRSVYTLWKRAAPPASMEIFNAPTRENCTVRRERTDTPLQALVTMNDVQFVEAARVLAERSMEESGEINARVDFITTRLLARPLTGPERQVVTKSFDDFRTYYAAHPADASKLLASGETDADPALPPADYAALTMVANELMNLDEVLNK